jgi:hypothetical protein
MPKKVLIITYYWPPAGGPGVQRWLKFVKYLPEFGIAPIVYCPENATYPLQDNSLINDVSSGITIIKEPIKEPYKLAGLFSKKSKTISKGIIKDEKRQGIVEKLMLYIRGNYFIPDARKSWIKPSVAFLENYIKTNQIDTIITTGPPHSLHLIGLDLKLKFDLKWIADFRDPWTTIGYHKKLRLTETSKEKHLQLESKVLKTADDIIVTSFNTKRAFSTKTTKPITVITNGFDDETVKIEGLDNKFTLAHIGSLLSERNPQILWQVLSELTNENSAFSKYFELILVGAVGESILESLALYGLKTHTNLVGYISHGEALIYQRKAQVLLLIEINHNDTKAIIPGKIFEYFNAKRPIIAVGPDGSDVESIIHHSNAGHYYLYNEKEALKQCILNHFNAYLENKLHSKAINIEQYHRRNLTNQLSGLLLKS